MLERLLNGFTSLRLTAVCLALATVLVFVGTIAQVDQGLYQAQARYFRSFFVYWSPGGSGWKIPVFPGGYLLGTVVLLNLIATTGRRVKFSRENLGLLMVHAGLILLLVGQLFTDVLSRESAMRIDLGETKSYSEDFHANELVLVDTTDPGADRVVSIPESRMAGAEELRVPESPLAVRVKRYWPNAEILNAAATGAEVTGATAGVGRGRFVMPRPPTAKLEERNAPGAGVEVTAGSQALGTWLVSSLIGEPQVFTHAGRTYEIALRAKRHYTPYSLTLLDCRHDVYKGTDIPKNYSSRVRVRNPATREDREVLIYMNNPLRYAGSTFYQYQMAPPEAPTKSSTLQVVRNPSWLTPYVSCTLVGLGLVVQFMSHLVSFLKIRTA
jgi:hypothetical protein